jgi:hypothetical protein
MRVRDFRADRSFFHLTSAAHPGATTQKITLLRMILTKKRKKSHKLMDFLLSVAIKKCKKILLLSLWARVTLFFTSVHFQQVCSMYCMTCEKIVLQVVSDAAPPGQLERLHGGVLHVHVGVHTVPHQGLHNGVLEGTDYCLLCSELTQPVHKYIPA